jgi:hypothetical protein
MEGLIWFAKPLYGLKPYQGFESLPLRHALRIFNRLEGNGSQAGPQ